MHVRRRLPLNALLMVLVAVFLAPPSAVAAAASDTCAGELAAPGEAPELCGTTIIRGDRSARMRVTVPADVIVNGNFFEKINSFTIEGQGDYLGFALSEAVPGRTGKTVLAYRGPGHWAGEPEASIDHKLFEFDPAADATEPLASHPTGAVELPTGTYDLYLIAEGKPVTVTLSFPGLDGQTELLPTEPANIRSETITPLTRQGNTSVSTATGSLRSPGIFQSVSWVLSPGAPWALNTVSRGDDGVRGHGAGFGQPPTLGGRSMYTLWSPPAERSIDTTIAATAGDSMVHGLWLEFGDVGGEASAPDSIDATARISHAEELDELVATPRGGIRVGR